MEKYCHYQYQYQFQQVGLLQYQYQYFHHHLQLATTYISEVTPMLFQLRLFSLKFQL